MNKQIEKNKRKIRRKVRTRAKIWGNSTRPRFNIYRSNKTMFLQLIDDQRGVTLVSANSKDLVNFKETKDNNKQAKQKIAFELGGVIAKKALDKKIKQVIFDRASYPYHGRVKAAAEGARAGGLIF